MATSNNTIRLSSVTLPTVIKPGSIVDLELVFEQDLYGSYRVSFEPSNLTASPRPTTKGAMLYGDILKIEQRNKGFCLQVEIPADVTISGMETLTVKLQQLDEKENVVENVQPQTASTIIQIEQPSRPVRVTEFPSIVSRKDSVPSQYTDNIILHEQIKEGTNAMRFPEFKRHLDFLLCGEFKGTKPDWIGRDANILLERRFLPFSDTDAYRVLKVATEAFVLLKCSALRPRRNEKGVIESLAGNDELNQQAQSAARRIGAVNVPSDPGNAYQNADPTKSYLKNSMLPYFRLVFDRISDARLKQSIFPGYDSINGEFTQQFQIPSCDGLLEDKLRSPILIELIWSYWHEQAMQVQTMFAIRNRFQNISTARGGDPLAGMEIGHLRPLNNLLWGYLQDEQHRLTLTRRNYEYEHHYGLSLQGKAIGNVQPADRRSKFLEAFHNLLYLASVYFKEDDDTNRKADAFPVLHALKEVHFLLSEGAHNQFGDLPTTSRIEMLMEQWLMSRREFQTFLPTRDSIAYPEEWMGTVDAMKSIQGWTSTSVMFFNDLARFGEQLLLSIRYDKWSDAIDRNEAANWAKLWRSEIQGYIHAFRIVTGVDLSMEPAGLAAEERRRDPSLLIQQRWEEQKRAGLARPALARVTATPTAGTLAKPQAPRLGRRSELET